MHKKIYNETIYKDSLYKQIKNILGDPKAFIKSRRDRKEIIYYKLKELTLFNDYSNFFNSKNQYSLKGFDQEKQDFVKIYYEAMEALIKRSDSAELKNQIRLSVNTIMQYCKKNGYIDSDDIFTITYVTNKIKPEELFDILLKIAVSSTSYVNIEENEINYNDISRVIFVNNFAKSFIIYLFYLILEDNPQVSSILCIIYPDIPNIMNGFDSKKHKQYFTKLSLQLIIIFNKVFNIEEKIINYTDDKNNYKTLTFLTLPDKISDLVIPPTHLPEIMEPNVEYNNLSDIINFSKSIKNGFSNVDLGQKTKKALIISQNKSFKINRNAIILFKKLDESPYSETKDLDLLPFTPIPHFIYLEDKIKDIESNIGFDTMGKIVNYYKEEVKGKYVDDLESKITSDLNITSEEYKLSQELYMLRKEYKKKIKLRILHNTIIKMAEIFEGFPIYYINAYDFRLRMYPWNYMFNRTSGIYKYMLEEHRQMVSVNGLKVMIKAYFKENPEQINQFENLTNKEEIINLFNKIEK